MRALEVPAKEVDFHRLFRQFAPDRLSNIGQQRRRRIRILAHQFGVFGHPIDAARREQRTQDHLLSREDAMAHAVGLEPPRDLRVDELARRMERMLGQEGHSRLLPSRWDREIALVGVAVVEILLFESADDSHHMHQLAITLRPDLAVHVLQELIVFALTASGRNEIAGDPIEIRQS